MLRIEYKTKKIGSGLLLACLLLVMTACENAPVRREDLLAQHPEWDAKTVNIIRSGKVHKGMSKEQVRAAWGAHCYTCQGSTEGDWGESWEYATQVVFFDADGYVVRLAIK